MTGSATGWIAKRKGASTVTRPKLWTREDQHPDLYHLQVGKVARQWASNYPDPVYSAKHLSASVNLWRYIRQTKKETHQRWLKWVRHRAEIGNIPQPVAGWVWQVIRGYTTLNVDETHQLVAVVRYLLANYCTRVDGDNNTAVGMWELKPETQWPRIECGAYTVGADSCTRRRGHQGRHVSAYDATVEFRTFAKASGTFVRSVREVA